MEFALKIFIFILFMTAVLTVVANIIIYNLRKKINNQFFSKNHLEKYEEFVASFLKEKQIEGDYNIDLICDKLGYKIEASTNLTKGREAEVSTDNVILYEKNLAYEDRTFDIAHEIAHIIRGYSETAARKSHSLKPRSVEEQICDYYAAAMLLPYKDLKKQMDEFDYFNKSKKERLRFIECIAKSKDVRKKVVIRRISEIKLLSSNT